MKPILKWVGNKSQILNEIEELVPENKEKYFEPFVGGGSVFFHLTKKRDYSYTCISDINDKLIITYKEIKERPYNLIEELKKMKKNYDRKNFRTQKGIYQRTRKSFNESNDNFEIASKMIFLNQLCFGGLYRTNSSGELNTAFLRKLIVDFDYENLLKASKTLKKTNIFCCDYKNILKCIDKDSFVFLDPPYYKAFDNYYYNSFDGKNLTEMFDFCCKIDDIGANFVLCNIKSKKVKNVFGERFDMNTVILDRKIRGQQKIREFLIYNK